MQTKRQLTGRGTGLVLQGGILYVHLVPADTHHPAGDIHLLLLPHLLPSHPSLPLPCLHHSPPLPLLPPCLLSPCKSMPTDQHLAMLLPFVPSPSPSLKLQGECARHSLHYTYGGGGWCTCLACHGVKGKCSRQTPYTVPHSTRGAWRGPSTPPHSHPSPSPQLAVTYSNPPYCPSACTRSTARRNTADPSDSINTQTNSKAARPGSQTARSPPPHQNTSLQTPCRSIIDNVHSHTYTHTLRSPVSAPPPSTPARTAACCATPTDPLTVGRAAEPSLPPLAPEYIFESPLG